MYPTLETARLILRPWRLGDEARLMDFSETLNATAPDDEMPPIHTIEDARRVVEECVKDGDQWAVVFKPDNLLIGWVGIRGLKKPVTREGNAWIWLDKAYQDKGLYGEALEKVADFGFNGIKTEKILIHLNARDFHGAPTVYDYTPPPEPAQSPYSCDKPVRKIDSVGYIKQPTDYLCGQSVVAMLAGVSVDEVIAVTRTDEGTSTADIRAALKWYGIKTASKARTKYADGDKLPDCCILSVKLPDYGHWSLYYKGKYYDPEFGVIDELPPNARLLYYWEIITDN